VEWSGVEWSGVGFSYNDAFVEPVAGGTHTTSLSGSEAARTKEWMQE